MKRLILLLMLLASTSYGTITRVQSASGNTGAANAATIAVTVSALTAGNYLLVSIASSVIKRHTVTLAAATDLVGGSVAQGYNSVGQFAHTDFYRIRTGGATTVNVNNLDALTSAYSVVVVEYSAKNLTPDVFATSTGGSATLVTGTTATTSYANEVVVATFCAAGTFSVSQTAWATTPTNSFSIVAQTSSRLNTAGNDRAVAFLEKFLTSTGTTSTGVTNANGSSQYATSIVTLREIPQVETTTSGD